MPDIDRKLLLKQVITDPYGLNMPTLPSNAKVIGIAKGNEGNKTGVYGFSERASAIYGESTVYAGFFVGDVEITGNLTLDAGTVHVADIAVTNNIHIRGDIHLTNADVAEEFEISGTAKVPPGTVMVFDSRGALAESQDAYDKRVAGVISGAGDYKPGLVLDKQESESNRQPVALMGKVFCKVDAQFGAVEVGDMLTSSPTPGHAMKASDPLRAFGSVIGKALSSLKVGQGLLPILVALQ
jgi:hypothetical protein